MPATILKMKSRKQAAAHAKATERTRQFRARRASNGQAQRIIVPGDADFVATEPRGFAVGGCECNKTPCQCGPMDGPMRQGYPANCTSAGACGIYEWENCYDRWARKAGCRPAILGRSHDAVIAGGEDFTVIVEPTNSEFFLPRRCQIEVVDAADPDVVSRLFITAVTINDVPQECGFNVQNPDPATNTAEIWSTFFTNVSGEGWPGVPVRWGPFSTAARTKVLRIIGYSPFPAPEERRINIQIMGYCADDLPSNRDLGVNAWKCGVYPGDVPPGEEMDWGCGPCRIDKVG